MDRERSSLEKQEKKVIIDIKASAKAGQNVSSPSPTHTRTHTHTPYIFSRSSVSLAPIDVHLTDASLFLSRPYFGLVLPLCEQTYAGCVVACDIPV